MHHRAEVEMANGREFSSYKDDGGDDDGEFGILSQRQTTTHSICLIKNT
jgi:hypothetical protein